jgi:thiopeptide-type bacteriocin biosynthesis protein
MYGPASAADRLLTGPITDLHRRLRDAGLVDRWFFIRYADPDRHLRVRFHGRPRELLREVMPALHEAMEPALETGDLYRISIDTYEREVERYGGIEGVELMEEIAEADSVAVLALLAGRLSAVERRHLAAMSVDALYAAGGLDLNARERCSIALRASRSREFKSVLLAREERVEREQVAAAVGSLTDPDGSAAVRVLRARSERLGPILERVRALEERQRLERPFEEVISAHAHMAINRLLPESGGFDELRVHDALARLYASARARESRQSGRTQITHGGDVQ